jgi:hypothetical protein
VSLNTVAQLATAFGVAISALTLICAFIFYDRQTKERYASELKADILLMRTRFERMAEMLKEYDFKHEIATCVVRDDLFYEFFEAMSEQGKKSGSNGWDGCVDEFFGAVKITAPVHAPLVKRYEECLKEVTHAAARYKAELPGFYRVAFAVRLLFGEIFDFYKHIARSEDHWSKILKEMR